MNSLQRWSSAFFGLLLGLFLMVPNALAFCGFYVAKADSKLYNQASQVAIARAGNRTVLTMASDYQGEVKDFAMVVPVPVVLQKEQVKVAEPKIMERLDAFSAPRLVEYFDENPCDRNRLYDRMTMPAPTAAGAPMRREAEPRQNLGVTIESKFTAGEYDILILSAKDSGGLETWLNQNGYQMPRGARDLLRPYIRNQMKFFVAKVNLEKFDSSGQTNLRPLQMSFDSPRFMLPIRLGMVNAKQAQDLIVYILSPEGQAEVTNYRTVKIPSGDEIPEYVKSEFSDFYRSMFDTSYQREDRRVAFLEHAWDMGSCDPCSAEPLNNDELKQAGVFWLDQSGEAPPVRPGGILPRRRPPVFNSRVFLTRLHVRYSRDRFPEDLMFQATQNQEQFQGRYVLRHPYKGDATCRAAYDYRWQLRRRVEGQAQTLARLTGWNINDIRKKLPKTNAQAPTLMESLWAKLRGMG
jgi:hypothetical protein